MATYKKLYTDDIPVTEEKKTGTASQTQTVPEQQVKPTIQEQLSETVSQILNRKPFQYDLNADALYQQYKDQYVQQGQMAMMDTMGQASALTGGYGNSYAQGVGQQAYQGYLQQLNDRIPDFYQTALSRYIADGDALADQYALLSNERDYEEDLRRWYYDNGLPMPGEETGATDAGASSGGSGGSSGSSGYSQSVAAYQKRLRDEGYDITVDGIYGPETQAAWDDLMKKQNGGGGDNEDITYSDVANTVVELKQAGANKNDIYQYISSTINSSNYIPTNSTKQDLDELRSAYVGNSR